MATDRTLGVPGIDLKSSFQLQVPLPAESSFQSYTHYDVKDRGHLIWNTINSLCYLLNLLLNLKLLYIFKKRRQEREGKSIVLVWI